LGKTKINIKNNWCSLEELKSHLEKQFKQGMTWSNHSLKGWHVDHIIPLSSAKSIKELEKLSHYTNLQPLWAKEINAREIKLGQTLKFFYILNNKY
jgi:hypothetical protein